MRVQEPEARGTWGPAAWGSWGRPREAEEVRKRRLLRRELRFPPVPIPRDRGQGYL